MAQQARRGARWHLPARGDPVGRQGETTAHVTAANGDRVGGRLSPDEPLRISADVEVDDDEEEVVAELKVAGKKATDLRHEAALTPPG